MQVSRYLKLTAISFTIKKHESSNTERLSQTLLKAKAKAKTPCFQTLSVREETPTLPTPSLRLQFGHSNYSYLPFPYLLLIFPFQSGWLSLITGHSANVEITKRKKRIQAR